MAREGFIDCLSRVLYGAFAILALATLRMVSSESRRHE